jgi:hypothetical protein
MAYTPAYAVNGSTNKALAQQAHTTLRSLLTGAPFTSGKGLKAAYINITFTSGDVYSANGVVANLLGQLPGWTRILTTLSDPYYNSNSTAAWERATFIGQNDATSTNRKMVLHNEIAVETVSDEVANGRVLTGVTITVLVLGY